MDLIGFLIGMLLLFFPPVALREQIQRAGDDIAAWGHDILPWHIMRAKSFIVRHILAFSAAIFIASLAWFYTLNRLEPGLLHHPIFSVCFYGLTAGQLAFAFLNYLNGRIHYRPLPQTTSAQRVFAARCLSRAQAQREAVQLANQRFETIANARDPLVTTTPELLAAALVAARFSRDLAVAYRQAAQAQATVHRAASAFGCSETVDQVLDTVSRIIAVVPGNPALEAFFNQTAQEASLAEQAAERAMAEEDQRAYTWLLPTRFSLPQVWAAAVLALLVTMGVYLNIYAVNVEDRWLFALSFVPLVMAYAIVKVAAEVFAWVLVKSTKATEFVTTKAAELGVAFLPGDTLASARERLKGGVNLLNEEEIAKGIRQWTNLLAIMWGPYAAIVFWFTNDTVAIAAMSATIIGSIFSLMYLHFGKKKEIDESTEKTVGFFWKYGKWITAALVLLGSAVEYDALMNKMAGITPVLVLDMPLGRYVLIALIFGIVMWVSWKAAGALKGKWEKVLKPIAVLTGAVALLCLLAPMARSANGSNALVLSPRNGSQAERQVEIHSPQVRFLVQPDGRQEMEITFLTKSRQSKGVVRFDPALAAQLGLPEADVPVRSFGNLVACGNDRCRKHVVVVPDLSQVPHGSYRIVMRRWLTVESSPSYRI